MLSASEVRFFLLVLIVTLGRSCSEWMKLFGVHEVDGKPCVLSCKCQVEGVTTILRSRREEKDVAIQNAWGEGF